MTEIETSALQDTGEQMPDPYEARARAVLGDELFEHCVLVGAQAPEPSPELAALIGRIFGPALLRLAARKGS